MSNVTVFVDCGVIIYKNNKGESTVSIAPHIQPALAIYWLRSGCKLPVKSRGGGLLKPWGWSNIW